MPATVKDSASETNHGTVRLYLVFWIVFSAVVLPEKLTVWQTQLSPSHSFKVTALDALDMAIFSLHNGLLGAFFAFAMVCLRRLRFLNALDVEGFKVSEVCEVRCLVLV